MLEDWKTENVHPPFQHSTIPTFHPFAAISSDPRGWPTTKRACIKLSEYDSILHMQTLTEIAVEKAREGIFTRLEAACWINGGDDRLNALIKRAVGSREVWRICRGLYCLDRRHLRTPVNPLSLAQHIYGPSYISLESALSHHGWIPEAVYTITSASMKRSRSFETPLGPFSFVRIPQSRFFGGVSRIETGGGRSFLMADPLKALADYVCAHNCRWTSADPVIDSLRVDEQSLGELKSADFDLLVGH